MDIVYHMIVFSTVAKLGSFTGAGAVLNTSTTNVSRAISNLEAHLKTKLVNRTTRKLSLTEAGFRYLDKCIPIIEAVREAEAEAADAQHKPSGKLRVHAMTSLGQYCIIDAAAQYRQHYPDVKIQVDLSNRIPSMLSDGYDISIIMANGLPDSGFISQKLGVTYSVVCASPGYVAQHGMVKAPADLKSHQCLRLSSPVTELENWLFAGPDGDELIRNHDAVFEVNTADGMKAALKADMGVGVLPIYVARRDLQAGELIRILPEFKLQELNIYAIYPSRTYLDAKTRTWLDLLKATIPAMLAMGE